MVDPFYMGYIIYQLIVVLVTFFLKKPSAHIDQEAREIDLHLHIEGRQVYAL